MTFDPFTQVPACAQTVTYTAFTVDSGGVETALPTSTSANDPIFFDAASRTVSVLTNDNAHAATYTIRIYGASTNPVQNDSFDFDVVIVGHC